MEVDRIRTVCDFFADETGQEAKGYQKKYQQPRLGVSEFVVVEVEDVSRESDDDAQDRVGRKLPIGLPLDEQKPQEKSDPERDRQIDPLSPLRLHGDPDPADENDKSEKRSSQEAKDPQRNLESLQTQESQIEPKHDAKEN